MPVIGGTTYHNETPGDVIHLLQRYLEAGQDRHVVTGRPTRTRIVIEYGDRETGQSWGDRETGYVSQSSGDVKVPILLHNARSVGGGAILDHCIVRISTARGDVTLWQHPNYAPAQ